MYRPTKVSNLELAFHAQQQILWLDVTVNDMFGVTVHQCFGQGSNVTAAAMGEVSQRGLRMRLLTHVLLVVQWHFKSSQPQDSTRGHSQV